MRRNWADLFWASRSISPDAQRSHFRIRVLSSSHIRRRLNIVRNASVHALSVQSIGFMLPGLALVSPYHRR
jgi:hypothetical protein